MIRAAALLATLVLPGCVAPEEPVVRRPVRPATQTALPAGLEPAPMADRKLSAPASQSVLQVEGMGNKKKSAPLPPL